MRSPWGRASTLPPGFCPAASAATGCREQAAGRKPGPAFRLIAVWLIAGSSASGHVISMSNGFATVTGNRVEYILRMPDYEIAPVKDPARALLDRIRFTSGLETARRVDGECHDDPSTSTLICAANYQFTAPVEKLGVECAFYQVTVPNHIHLLRAERAGRYDQAILDSAFSSATLAFRPPTAVETAVGESAAGAVRVWTNFTQVLLLIAIALAARSRREFAVLFAAFLAGECGGTAILLRTLWQPPLRFAEAAAALALAYLALEILAFPKSGGRWVLALLFGGFQGMFFALFVSDSGYGAGWVLTGASFAALAVAGLCAIPRPGPILRKVAASVFLATGIVWFCIRLRS
jgi:hypothetical protein